MKYPSFWMRKMVINGQIMELPLVLMSMPQKSIQNWRGYCFCRL